MADVDQRRLERAAAAGDPDAQARLRHERCRVSGHRWAPAYFEGDTSTLVHPAYCMNDCGSDAPPACSRCGHAEPEHADLGDEPGHLTPGRHSATPLDPAACGVRGCACIAWRP